MDDNAVFCTSCGAKNDVPAASATTNAYQSNSGSSGETPLDQLKGKTSEAISNFKNSPQKNTYIGIAVVAVAIVILIILLVKILGGSYKGALGDYFEAICEKDGEAYLEITTPDKMIDYVEDETNQDLDDLEDAAKDTVKKKYDKLKDEFGKDLKISFKVTDKDKADKDDLDDLNDMIDELYDGDLKLKFKQAYELELELKIKGDDDKEDEIEATAYVCKINGDWIVLSFTCDDYSALNTYGSIF